MLQIEINVFLPSVNASINIEGQCEYNLSISPSCNPDQKLTISK